MSKSDRVIVTFVARTASIVATLRNRRLDCASHVPDRLACNLKRRVTFGIAKSFADAPKREFWRSEGHHQCPTVIHIISRTLTTGGIGINPD